MKAGKAPLPLVLFAAALAVRVLFWQATTDAGWSYSAAYKGDASLWLEYAGAIEQGRPFELGLPFRPPGTAWLIALLAAVGIDTVKGLRLAWCVLGALVAPLTFLAARERLPVRLAATAGGLTAVATGLMLLSASLDSETPYLVLALGALWLFERLRRRAAAATLAAFGALHGIACLFRAEHLLLALATGGLLALERRRSSQPLLRGLAAVAAAFVLVLLPWHLRAWSAVRAYNTQGPTLSPAEAAPLEAVEARLRWLRWEEGAERRRLELPAFARRTAGGFVAATVAYRGGTVVREADFAILEEAFGSVPQPLARRPFVALYGPLNFALANHGGAEGGFNRAPLEEPPPLRGGAGRYPPILVQGLPPPQLAFIYPPHLALVNEGYGRGLGWMASQPAAAAGLLARKAARFWSGAASGVTGFNLPLGLSGTRHAVDLVTPEGGPLALAWRLGVLLLVVAGLWRGRRQPTAWAWAALLASRLAAGLLFFGYARLGATALPAVAVLAAVALEPWLARITRAAALGGVLLAAAVSVEAARAVGTPELFLDGRRVEGADPFPIDLHTDQRLEVRWP